jgi:hypothetical protein
MLRRHFLERRDAGDDDAANSRARSMPCAMLATLGVVLERTLMSVRTMVVLIVLGVTIFLSRFLPTIETILTDSVNAIAACRRHHLFRALSTIRISSVGYKPGYARRGCSRRACSTCPRSGWSASARPRSGTSQSMSRAIMTRLHATSSLMASLMASVCGSSTGSRPIAVTRSSMLPLRSTILRRHPHWRASC